MSEPKDSHWLIAFITVSGVVVYFNAIASAILVWSRSPDEQHGFLVLPVSLILLYLRRGSFPAEARIVDFRGCLLLSLAAFLRIYGDMFVRPWMEMWSLPFWIGGVVWLFMGWRVFYWALPAIAFLFFLAPLPGQIQTAAGYPLQLIAATAGGWILQMLGQPAFVAGTTILLGENVLDVERACAGLRMFQGMLAVSVAWSLFSGYSLRRLLILFAIAPMVAILVNIARIAVTGLLFQWVSGEAARAFTHDWAGLLMIPVGAVTYFCIDTVVDRVRNWNRNYPERWLFTLSASAVSVVLLAIAANLMHKRQQERAVDFVLIQARELQAKNSTDSQKKAEQLFQRYLSVRPKDSAVLIEFAKLSVGMGRDQWMRAARLYELAWKANPQRQSEALSALETFKNLGAWQQLWEKSNEFYVQFSDAEARTSTLRLRTFAIGQLIKAASVPTEIDKMAVACKEAIEKDSDFLEHHWQSALLARVLPRGLPKENLLQRISQGLSEEAKNAFPIDPTTLAKEKIIRDELQSSDAEALAIVDRCLATHPSDPLPLLYRVAILKAVNGKSFRPAVAQAIEDSISSCIDRALEMVAKDEAQLANARPDPAIKDPAIKDTAIKDPATTANVFFVAGQRALQRGEREQAQEYLSRSKTLRPTSYQVYLLLADLIPKDAFEKRIELFAEARRNCGNNELTITLPLAEAYLGSGRDDEAQALLKPLEKILPRLQVVDRGKIEVMLACTRASGLALKRQKREAAELLSKSLQSQTVVAQRRNFSALYARAQFQLGSLLRSINQESAAAAAFHEGGQFDPDSSVWHVDAAQAYEVAGNLNAALNQYQRAAAIVGKFQPNIYLSIARCNLAIQRQTKPTKTGIEEVRSVIRLAEGRGADASMVTVLMAESYVIVNDFNTALQILDSHLKRNPTSPQVLFSSAIIRQMAGDVAGSKAAADRYEVACASPPDALMLRVLLLERSGRLDLAANELEKANSHIKAEDLKAARTHLVTGNFRQGNTDNGVELLKSLASDYADDLPIQRLAADLFGELRMDNDLNSVEKNLRRIEGENGTYWRTTRIARLLRNSSGKSELEEAEKLLTHLEQTLPDWPRTNSLRGLLSEKQGLWPLALASYERAWGAGMRDANLASSILTGLYKTGQEEKASELISQLEDLVPNSTSLFDRAMPQFVQGNKSEYVLNLARRWTVESPSSENWVRLGQTLIAIARSRQSRSVFKSDKELAAALVEAEQSLAKAIQSDPANIAAWISSFQLQADVLKDRDVAVQKLEQMSQQLDIPPAKRSFVLAQLYLAIGEGARAGKLFEEALQLVAGESKELKRSVILVASQFYATRRIEKAIQLCRSLLSDASKEDEEVKNQLVSILALQNSHQALSEAIKLHDPASATTIQSDGNKKQMLAKMLIRRADLYPATMAEQSKADRERAITLLESITPSTAENAFLLADLYAASDQSIRALNTYRESFRLESPTPARLIHFVHFWNKQYAKSSEYKPIADQYLNELKRIPGYKSEWLRLSLEREQFRGGSNTTLPPTVPSSSPSELELALVDQFSKSIELSSSSDALSAEIFELVAGVTLAQREEMIPRVLDGLADRMESIGKKAKDETLVDAVALATINLASKPKASALMESWLRKHLPAKSIGSAATARAIADAVYISGNPTASIEYYKVAIEQNPQDVNAANNLAAATAEEGNTDDDAYQWVDLAIKMEPNNPERKDTKLIVAILHKDWDQATAISNQLSDQYSGSILMHRAFAAAEQGFLDQAKQLFDQSRDANVERTLIVPSDKNMFLRLQNLFLSVDRLVGQPVP